MQSLKSLFAPEEPRLLAARLAMVIETLPTTIVLNPLWTAFLFTPFLIAHGTFGHVPLSHLFYAVGLLCLQSCWAFVLYRRGHREDADFPALEASLIRVQFALSVSWGAMCWLYWDAASPVNVIYVTMILVTVTWAVVYTRTTHTRIFIAGLVPLTMALWARLLTTPGEVAAILAGLMPLWTVYIVLMGIRGRGKIDALLTAQFANEDLSGALRTSHEDALQKRYEAETANSAKTTFLANMSHELRTPLNAILGFSDIISHQSLGPQAAERYMEYARDIHSSGTHLLSLINDLLDVAKIEAGKMEIDPQPVDVRQTVEGIERLMSARTAARNQTLRCRIEAGLPWLMADERAFRQIVLNLVSNAVKFTPQGGEIEIACRRTHDGGIVLEVEDNGPGIPQDRIARVFQPFSQIDNRYGRQSGGTGLGLALVQGLVHLHGGRAEIESTVGVGTRVSVYFPLVVETLGRAAAVNE